MLHNYEGTSEPSWTWNSQFILMQKIKNKTFKVLERLHSGRKYSYKHPCYITDYSGFKDDDV